jgi:hypothetical protein
MGCVRSATAGSKPNKPEKQKMAKQPPQMADYDLDAEAQIALDEARALKPGPEKTEALKKAGLLRNAADAAKRESSTK